MESLTIADPKTKLKHILKNVLALPSDSTLAMAIKQNGLTSIDIVLTNNDAAIANLKYVDGFIKFEKNAKLTPQTLLPGVVMHICTRQMSAYCIEKLDPILDWMDITQNNYIVFLHTILPMYNGTLFASVPPPLLKPKSPTSALTNFPSDPLKDWA